MMLALFACASGMQRDPEPIEELIPLYDSLNLTSPEIVKATGAFTCKNVVAFGARSTVYKGNLSEGVTIMVKVLHPTYYQGKGVQEEFLRQLLCLRNLRHRNIQHMYGLYKSIHIRALIVEHVANGNLQEQLHGSGPGGNLPWDVRLNIASDVAKGLAYLHERQILHLDLKPSNILLTSQFGAKVSNFGFHRSTKFERLREMSAKGYAPPESEVSNHVSTKVDVYSFGVLLLELLTGKAPTDETFKTGNSLTSWVSEALTSSGGVQAVLAHVLKSGFEHSLRQKQVLATLRLGLLCVSDAPQHRPEMKDVSDILTKTKYKKLDEVQNKLLLAKLASMGQVYQVKMIQS